MLHQTYAFLLLCSLQPQALPRMAPRISKVLTCDVSKSAFCSSDRLARRCVV